MPPDDEQPPSSSPPAARVPDTGARPPQMTPTQAPRLPPLAPSVTMRSGTRVAAAARASFAAYESGPSASPAATPQRAPDARRYASFTPASAPAREKRPREGRSTPRAFAVAHPTPRRRASDPPARGYAAGGGGAERLGMARAFAVMPAAPATRRALFEVGRPDPERAPSFAVPASPVKRARREVAFAVESAGKRTQPEVVRGRRKRIGALQAAGERARECARAYVSAIRGGEGALEEGLVLRVVPGSGGTRGVSVADVSGRVGVGRRVRVVLEGDRSLDEDGGCELMVIAPPWLELSALDEGLEAGDVDFVVLANQIAVLPAELRSSVEKDEVPETQLVSEGTAPGNTVSPAHEVESRGDGAYSVKKPESGEPSRTRCADFNTLSNHVTQVLLEAQVVAVASNRQLALVVDSTGFPGLLSYKVREPQISATCRELGHWCVSRDRVASKGIVEEFRSLGTSNSDGVENAMLNVAGLSLEETLMPLFDEKS